jgi:hypothetical protein
MPSFSSIASIISANSGTNTVAVVTPNSSKPIMERILFSGGKCKILDGPIMKIEQVAMTKDT